MSRPTALTLEMYRYGNIVFGCCLYLNAEHRGRGILAENTKYQIVSDTEPSIVVEEEEKTILNVRGNDQTSDEKRFFYEYEDAELAEEFTMNISRLVNRLNGKAESSPNLFKVL